MNNLTEFTLRSISIAIAETYRKIEEEKSIVNMIFLTRQMKMLSKCYVIIMRCEK